MSKLKLSEWANIAEIIGALAIVVSLVYVGMQIDQNTSEIRAASVQSIVEREQQLNLTMATDPVLRVAISKTIAGNEAMTTEELQAMRQVLLALLRVLEDTYSKYQLGYLSEDFIRSRTMTVTNLLERSEQLEAMYEEQKAIGIYPLDFVMWLGEQREILFPDQ